MSTLKRFKDVLHVRGMESWREMELHDTGEYCLYEEAHAIEVECDKALDEVERLRSAMRNLLDFSEEPPKTYREEVSPKCLID